MKLDQSCLECRLQIFTTYFKKNMFHYHFKIIMLEYPFKNYKLYVKLYLNDSLELHIFVIFKCLKLFNMWIKSAESFIVRYQYIGDDLLEFDIWTIFYNIVSKYVLDRTFSFFFCNETYIKALIWSIVWSLIFITKNMKIMIFKVFFDNSAYTQ